MTFNGISDLASSIAMQRRTLDIRKDFDASSQRLTTGLLEKEDIVRNGHAGRVLAIDRSMELNKRFGDSIASGTVRLETMQAALGNVRESSFDIAVNVASLLGQDSFTMSDIQAEEAETALQGVVAALNTNVSGQTFFSGAHSDRAALLGSDTIMTDIEAILAAAPDTATAIADVDFYFNDPTGGFFTTIYTGAAQDGPDISVAEGDNVAVTTRADDPAIRETLRNLALIGAVAKGAYTGSMADIETLLRDGAETQLNTNEDLVRLQERLGFSQEYVENARVANEAAHMRLSVSRNDLAGADSYEEVSRFNELQSQLEMLYTVTARRSGMTLTNFLR